MAVNVLEELKRQSRSWPLPVSAPPPPEKPVAIGTFSEVSGEVYVNGSKQKAVVGSVLYLGDLIMTENPSGTAFGYAVIGLNGGRRLVVAPRSAAAIIP